jgi:hypothetical protein
MLLQLASAVWKEPAMTRAAVVVCAALLIVVTSAGPGGAVGAFGPRATVIDLNCGTNLQSRAVLGGDGIVRGWAVAEGPGCSDQIWFFQGAGQSWARVRSPYQGRLLDAGYDGTGAYLLYQAADGIRITKRSAGGTFTTGRLLSAATTAFSAGAVTATGGTWWAVWGEPTGVNQYGDQVFSLFQAKTYGTDQTRQQITFLNGTGESESDSNAALALRPGGGAVLAWQRDQTEFPVSSHIRIATSLDGRWTSRVFASLGDLNQTPDLVTDAKHTYVVWLRGNDRIVEADNTSGVFRSHTFATPGGVPSVAVSLGRVFVVWSTLYSFTTTASVFVAERRGGSWTGLRLSRSTPSHEFAAGVTARDGKATVRFLGSGPNGREILYARTQV